MNDIALESFDFSAFQFHLNTSCYFYYIENSELKNRNFEIKHSNLHA